MRARLLVFGTLVLASCGSSDQTSNPPMPDGGSSDGNGLDVANDRTVQDAARDTGADSGIDAAEAAADVAVDSTLDASFDGVLDVSLDTALDVGLDTGLDGPVDAPIDAPGDRTLPSCADGGGVVLASGQASPFWIDVDSTNVYWTNVNGGQVMECAIGDCCANPVTLAAGQAYPSGVSVDGGNVYWINQGPMGPGTGSIASCAVGGCGGVPTILSTGQGGDDMIAAGSILFWSNNYSSAVPQAGRLMTCSLTGGCMATTRPFVSSDVSDAGTPIQPLGIAVDSTNVYWADYGTGWVMAASQSGASMQTLATGQTLVRDVVVDAMNVYWVTYEPLTVAECPKTGCNGAPLTLYTAPSPTDTGNSIAVDATDVYFTTSLGILKCATGGCNGSPTVLTSATPTNYYADIAVDGVSVYWTDARTGEVLMLPK